MSTASFDILAATKSFLQTPMPMFHASIPNLILTKFSPITPSMITAMTPTSRTPTTTHVIPPTTTSTSPTCHTATTAPESTRPNNDGVNSIQLIIMFVFLAAIWYMDGALHESRELFHKMRHDIDKIASDIHDINKSLTRITLKPCGHSQKLPTIPPILPSPTSLYDLRVGSDGDFHEKSLLYTQSLMDPVVIRDAEKQYNHPNHDGHDEFFMPQHDIPGCNDNNKSKTKNKNQHRMTAKKHDTVIVHAEQ